MESTLVDPIASVERNLRVAVSSGKWMSVMLRIEGGSLHIDRVAINFPDGDIGLAQRMIIENLDKMKGANQDVPEVVRDQSSIQD